MPTEFALDLGIKVALFVSPLQEFFDHLDSVN